MKEIELEKERAILTVKETAHWLRLSRNSCYQAVLRGEIPSLRVGRRILIPKAALLRKLSEAEAKPQKTI